MDMHCVGIDNCIENAKITITGPSQTSIFTCREFISLKINCIAHFNSSKGCFSKDLECMLCECSQKALKLVKI